MKSKETAVTPFPPITKLMALEIAAQTCPTNQLEYKCYSQKPKNCTTYGIKTNDACWYVIAPWNDEPYVLRSSRLIVISRVTGEVLYNGSAQDEG